MRGPRLAAGLFKASMAALVTTGAYQNREILEQGYRDAQKLAETSGVSAKVLDLTTRLKGVAGHEFDPVDEARDTLSP
ncbi:MAG: hypothetical protein P1U63_02100 [Coxiellaceae bacterium]|nr:hypothetical protein [Coxiellaceae bacterium]